MQILRLTPTLSELQLIRQPLDQLPSRPTHGPSDSDQLVPSLHTIELTFAKGEKPLLARLADMIESRWNFGDASGEPAQDKVTNIKCVRVFLERSMYQTYNWETCMRLQRLRDEGLEYVLGSNLISQLFITGDFPLVVLRKCRLFRRS